MLFKGIGRLFSTEDDRQFETIGAFWDELAAKYGRANLQGLGYGWTERSIEYVIGLIDVEVGGEDWIVTLPDTGWVSVQGWTKDPVSCVSSTAFVVAARRASFSAARSWDCWSARWMSISLYSILPSFMLRRRRLKRSGDNA